MRAFPKRVWLSQRYNFKRDKDDDDTRIVHESLSGAMKYVREHYVAEYRLVGFKKYHAKIEEVR